jgi:ABC-2 type transport system permease protein
METVSPDKRSRLKSVWHFILFAAIVIIAARVICLFNFRVDLTEDRRYTLSGPTLEVLDNLVNDVFIQVYLDGEMPIPMKRLRRSVREMLDEFHIASGRKVDHEFINPADAANDEQRDALFSEIYRKGLVPVNVRAGDKEGGASQKMIFPGMIVNYNGIEMPVNFLKNNQRLTYEQNILHSIESIEYEIIQTIATISADTIHKVAFLEGHGELVESEVADLTRCLSNFFTVDRGTVGGRQGALDNYSAVIVAGPSGEFNEEDKLVLDQYIMNGGKVLWLYEAVSVNNDSLMSNQQTVCLYRPLNIEDQLFRYGVRVNPDIIQDVECAQVRLVMITGAEQKQVVPFSWFYYPLLIPNRDHQATRNINRVKGEYTNTIDTVGLDAAIKKTVLLSTSSYSRTLSPPMIIRLSEVERSVSMTDFNRSSLPVAVLLEGFFTSAFRNRVLPGIHDPSFKFRVKSEKNRMIVVADMDIARNEISRSGTDISFLPLGQDKYTGEMFGNRDFLVNCINYLVDDNGLMELRSREIKQRLLDDRRVREERIKWQIINVAGPVLLVILAGLTRGCFRKRKYAISRQ